MKLRIGANVVLALCLSTNTASGQDDARTPSLRYSEILKEYNSISGGLRKATTDLQRNAAVERLAPFASKFVDLAAKHPDDPIALTALIQAVQVDCSTDSAALQTWEMNQSNFPAGSSDGAAARAVALVLRDHILSDKLGPVIDRMRYAYRMEFETCLDAILEQNPHHEVRALACLALAQFLSDRLRMLQLVDDRPELADCYEIVFGKDYLPELRRGGKVALETRIEALFERAADEFGDVKFRTGTVGESARSELYDIHHLRVGKVAPEIEGKDQDGRQFKLTDYRGKIVLLYFWSEY